MWDFLLSDFQHYLKPHKQSTLDWIQDQDGGQKLIVNYSKIHNKNSSGFRIELFLEPETVYQLDLEAKLEIGDPAFIYVESGHHRLVPRFKIYQGEHGYRLKHNFETPMAESSMKDDSGGYIPVYLGILFHHSDQDYRLKVSKLRLTKVAKLTPETLEKLSEDNDIQNAKNYEQSFFDQSTMFSHFSSTLEKKLEELESRLKNMSQPGISGPILTDKLKSVAPHFSEIKSVKDQHRIENNKMIKSKLGPDLEKLVNIQDIPDGKVKKIIKLDTNIWLPSMVTEDLLQAMTNRKNELKTRLVASVTVIPSRVKTLRQVVESVANQKFPIDLILVVVPERYKRKNQAYLINSHTWYTPKKRKGGKNYPEIKIIRAPDVGPMTKLYPVLKETNPEDLILTFDDDHHYPEYWSLYLSYLHLTHPDFRGIYGFEGHDTNQHLIKSQLCSQPTNVQWLESQFGICYPRNLFVNEKLMLKQTGFSKDCCYSDSILVSNHLGKTNVARIVLPQINPLVYDNVIPRAQQWETDWNSLSRMTPKPIARYAAVRRLLKEKNYSFLNKMGPILKKKLHEKLSVNSDCFQAWNSEIKDQSDDRLLAPNLDQVPSLVTSIGFGEGHLEFDPDYFSDKNVRYLSYLENVYQPEIVLLYVRKLKSVTLEMPRVDHDMSLPADYAPWLVDGSETITNYDAIIVDIPFCGNEIIKLKTRKPVFYIYRYPDIGKPRRLVNYKLGDIEKNELKKEPKMIINSQHFFKKHEVEKNLYLWRILPELIERRIPMNLNKKIHHLCSIVTDPYYVSGVTELIKFWSKRGQDLPIHLHLGVTSPYYEKVGAMVNSLEIKNLSVYSASNIFPTLIKNCAAYISFTSSIDLYAIWASQQGKHLIMMRYGEFAEYPKINAIPFTMGEKSVCPEELINHSKCTDDFCFRYGYKTIDSIPIVNNQVLHKILIQTYLPKKV